ncbi:uncharacterized protein LOC115606170 [Strigops habroptila]|uniref:uncharacterized protein LOC115606170 n=1 Tax=Strigops habroptila TaxID=2489341 RepID=UPI0011CF9890|nr:uncharacterized protein LOC115606170 [Strigops habroptila]
MGQGEPHTPVLRDERGWGQLGFIPGYNRSNTLHPVMFNENFHGYGFRNNGSIEGTETRLAPIDRGGQPEASPGTALTSGAKVQPGEHRAAAGQPEPGPRSTMRLGLLCGLAAAAVLMAVAGADRGDTKITQGREGTSGVGRRRPHRPCSGCFSVLSEESRSMSWRASEDNEVQPRRRERDRREDKKPARHMRHPSTVQLPRQEVLSARTARQGATLVSRHSSTPGENRRPGQRQAMH